MSAGLNEILTVRAERDRFKTIIECALEYLDAEDTASLCAYLDCEGRRAMHQKAGSA